MRKRIKGFTLIECIIAMFILALAALVFVQAYGGALKIYKKNVILQQKFDAQMSVAADEEIYEDDTPAGDRNTYKANDMSFKINYSPINSTSKTQTCSISSDLYEVTLDRHGKRKGEEGYDNTESKSYNYSYYHTDFTPYTSEEPATP